MLSTRTPLAAAPTYTVVPYKPNRRRLRPDALMSRLGALERAVNALATALPPVNQVKRPAAAPAGLAAGQRSLLASCTSSLEAHLVPIGGAQQALLRRDFRRAEELARCAIELSPRRAASYVVLSTALARQHDWKRAGEAAARAVEVVDAGGAPDEAARARSTLAAYHYFVADLATVVGPRRAEAKAGWPAWMRSARALRAEAERVVAALPDEAAARDMRASALCVDGASASDMRRAAAEWRRASELKAAAQPWSPHIDEYLERASSAARGRVRAAVLPPGHRAAVRFEPAGLPLGSPARTRSPRREPRRLGALPLGFAQGGLGDPAPEVLW